MPPVAIPKSGNAKLKVQGREVQLTNLDKPFWPELGITKGDLLQYYADVAPVLLPHLADRAMVMKRYPHGAHGEFFFMKRAPSPRPDWIETCRIDHDSGNVIDFPMIQDLASLLWVVNLGCIDLNQWYARCDDVDRPDYLHFDLDPGRGRRRWNRCSSAALIVRDALDDARDAAAREDHRLEGAARLRADRARADAEGRLDASPRRSRVELAARHSDADDRRVQVAKRPRGRVLVDYNQNAWGRTLASIYSVRPQPRATVSTPVTWKEIEQGCRIEDFRLDNVPRALREGRRPLEAAAAVAGPGQPGEVPERREGAQPEAPPHDSSEPRQQPRAVRCRSACTPRRRRAVTSAASSERM